MALPKLWVQEIPAYLNLVWYVGVAGTKVLSGKFPIHFSKIYAVFKNNFLSWCYEEDDLFRIGKYIEEHIGEFPQIIDNWRKNELKRFYASLKSDFKEFEEAYLEEYSIPLLADAVSFYCEREIKKETKNNYKLISEITTPSFLSFLAEEKKELYELIELKKKGIDIEDKLKKHRDRWYFILNNYYNVYDLSIDYFRKRIKEHMKNNDYAIQMPKKKNLSNLSPRLRRLVYMLDMFSEWQDERKRANLIANYHIVQHIKDLIGKTGNNYLYLATPKEIDMILVGKTIEGLEKRKKYSAIIFSKENTEPLSFEESYKLYHEIHSDENFNHVNDIYGTVANIGKVIGRAKVILSNDDFNKINDGDILITTTTRPEFMPILKKVKGIIADEGGMSSHAAIVSRELNIPCILGTKIATRAIKDNYLIELNANHGIIRILEK